MHHYHASAGAVWWWDSVAIACSTQTNININSRLSERQRASERENENSSFAHKKKRKENENCFPTRDSVQCNDRGNATEQQTNTSLRLAVVLISDVKHKHLLFWHKIILFLRKHPLCESGSECRHDKTLSFNIRNSHFVHFYVQHALGWEYCAFFYLVCPFLSRNFLRNDARFSWFHLRSFVLVSWSRARNFWCAKRRQRRME